MSSILKQVKADRVQVIPHAEIDAVSGQPIGDVAAQPIQSPEDALAWAQGQVERLLAEARQEAQTALDAAADKATAIETEAYLKGYEEGRAQGRADAAAEMETELAAASAQAASLLREAQLALQHWLSGMPAVFTEIVMDALRYLLNRELQLEPADIAAHVTRLIQSVADAASVEVRVHPDDFAAAREAHGTWQSARFGTWTISIVPDPEVSPGGAQVVSDSGRVDGRMETRLDLVGETLARVMERRMPDELGSGLS